MKDERPRTDLDSSIIDGYEFSSTTDYKHDDGFREMDGDRLIECNHDILARP